jgi:hypothetical protein
MSHDEKSVTGPRRFLIDVEETIRVVLEQEDTDGDFQISVTDAGPKMMALGTATSNGFKTFDIRVRHPNNFIYFVSDLIFDSIGHIHAIELAPRIGFGTRSQP